MLKCIAFYWNTLYVVYRFLLGHTVVLYGFPPSHLMCSVHFPSSSAAAPAGSLRTKNLSSEMKVASSTARMWLSEWRIHDTCRWWRGERGKKQKNYSGTLTNFAGTNLGAFFFKYIFPLISELNA